MFDIDIWSASEDLRRQAQDTSSHLLNGEISQFIETSVTPNHWDTNAMKCTDPDGTERWSENCHNDFDGGKGHFDNHYGGDGGGWHPDHRLGYRLTVWLMVDDEHVYDDWWQFREDIRDDFARAINFDYERVQVGGSWPDGGRGQAVEILLLPPDYDPGLMEFQNQQDLQNAVQDIENMFAQGDPDGFLTQGKQTQHIDFSQGENLTRG